MIKKTIIGIAALGALALGVSQLGAVNTIPTESEIRNLPTASLNSRTIPEERVVDFVEHGDIVRFAYFSDAIPPVYEDENLKKRTNNSWVRDKGVGKHGITLGKESRLNGEHVVYNEYNIFSQGAWVKSGNPKDPNNWRELEYATSTKTNFDRTNARERVALYRLGGQKAFNDGLSLLSVIFGRYAWADTFSPDEGTGATTVDSRMRHSSNSSWDDVHDAAAATGDVLPTNMTDRVTAQEDSSSTKWIIDRTIETYDLSAFAGPATAATLDLWPTSITNGDDDGLDYIQIVQSAPASDNDVIGDDFDTLGTTAFATGLDLGSLSTGQYNTWTFNATGLAYLNGQAGDIARIGLREGHDFEDTSIAGDTLNDFQISSADTAGSTQDPVLTLTAAAGGDTGFQTSIFMLNL